MHNKIIINCGKEIAKLKVLNYYFLKSIPDLQFSTQLIKSIDLISVKKMKKKSNFQNNFFFFLKKKEDKT